MFLVSLIIGCETDKRYPPQGYIPNTAKATTQLEAQYFWTPQDKINSSYWKDANFVELALSDIETRNLYGDGYLNMTGTYYGIESFNRGRDSEAKLRAGYDDEYLYILIEWKDTTTNASFMTWKWQGSEDIIKDDSTAGWTSQKNQDNVTLLFNKDDGSGKDAWKWSLAYTAPFDMALNLDADNNGAINNIVIPAVRNASSEGSRVGPAFEWDGARQEIVMDDGSIKILDPAFYLLDENKMPIPGDIKAGETVFNKTAHCSSCHGPNGNGQYEGETDGGPIDSEFSNKYTREGLVDYISSSSHEGSAGKYWGQIQNNPTQIENLITHLRGIAGVPGHILILPKEKEIATLTNISLGGIDRKNTIYKVLFKRKLESLNAEDVNFAPNKSYKISVKFSDNDDINSVGSSEIELIFKSKAL